MRRKRNIVRSFLFCINGTASLEEESEEGSDAVSWVYGEAEDFLIIDIVLVLSNRS